MYVRGINQVEKFTYLFIYSLARAEEGEDLLCKKGFFLFCVVMWNVDAILSSVFYLQGQTG